MARDADRVEDALLVLRTEPVVDPVGRRVAPDQDVPVDRDVLRLQEVDDGRGGGTPPVAVGERLFARERVPVVLRVKIVSVEAVVAGRRLDVDPVERDGRLVEEPALPVHRLVDVVVFRLAELVEVEDVRAEAEVVAELLDRHLRTVRRRDGDVRVRLAVPLDVRVDPRLLRVVPDLPVSVGHHRLVDLDRRRGHRRARRAQGHNLLLHSS